MGRSGQVVALETAHIAHAQSPPLAGWRIAKGVDDFNWPKFSLWAWHLPPNTVRALKGEIKHNLWTGAKNTSAKDKSKWYTNIGYAGLLGKMSLTSAPALDVTKKWKVNCATDKRRRDTRAVVLLWYNSAASAKLKKAKCLTWKVSPTRMYRLLYYY